MIGDQRPMTAEEAWRTAFDGCLAGYPLVTLDAARRRHPSGPNQFVHIRAGDADASWLGAMNPHVVYSSAWLDLRGGPVVVSLPELHAHHCVMPMIDAWGAIFMSLGVRRRGEGAQHLVVVGPAWSGAATDDLPVVRAPTDAVWLLGRTLTDSYDEDAHAPWNDYFLTAKGPRPAGAPPGTDDGWDGAPAPSSEPAAFDGGAFLNSMAALMARHPPPPSYWPLIQRLARLGVTRCAPFDLGRLPPELADATLAGVDEARRGIEAAAWPTAPAGASPWIALSRPGGGRLDPLGRAAIARRGLGFNLREDAIYFLSSQDAEGRPLRGDMTYRLHFEPRRRPPVGAFWSLAAYDLDGRLVQPVDGRVGLSSRDPLRFNEDGSLDIRIQAHRPAGPSAINWLPTPSAPFRLILRTYWPGQPVVDGRWVPPPLERTDVERRPGGRPTTPPLGAPSGRTVVHLGATPDSGQSCSA